MYYPKTKSLELEKMWNLISTRKKSVAKKEIRIAKGIFKMFSILYSKFCAAAKKLRFCRYFSLKPEATITSTSESETPSQTPIYYFRVTLSRSRFSIELYSFKSNSFLVIFNEAIKFGWSMDLMICYQISGLFFFITSPRHCLLRLTVQHPPKTHINLEELLQRYVR